MTGAKLTVPVVAVVLLEGQSVCLPGTFCAVLRQSAVPPARSLLLLALLQNNYVATDFIKAFEKKWASILTWVSSYLAHRFQYVGVNGKYSFWPCRAAITPTVSSIISKFKAAYYTYTVCR